MKSCLFLLIKKQKEIKERKKNISKTKYDNHLNLRKESKSTHILNKTQKLDNSKKIKKENYDNNEKKNKDQK